MSGIVYEEDIIYDIKDYLSANLDTYLTAIETLKDDGVKLQDLKRYDVGDKDIYKLNQYPAGLMFPNEINFEALTLASDDLKLQIILTVAIRGGKTENLTIKALRYAAAFRQCIDADRTAGDAVDRLSVKQVIFYAKPPGIEDKMVIDIVIDTEKEIPR